MKNSKKIALILSMISLFTSILTFAWSVYFNAPPSASSMKSSLMVLLSRAQNSINLVIYNLTDEDVIGLLKEKEDEGVNVRIVMEGKNYAENVQRLKIFNVVADQIQGGLMHEKFAVVDDRYVWLGSANFTPSSFYKDLNNTVILDSYKLARVLNVEFDRMYENGFFSYPQTALATSLSVEGMRIDVNFSPNGGCFEKIIDAIKSAKRDIYVAVYAFSDPRIALTLMLMQERGVKIHVLADSKWNHSSYSVMEQMREFDFKFYDNPYGLLHDKYMIIDPLEDDAQVLTGSYNFTRSAQTKNDEILVVFHSKKLAQIYLENFELLSKPLLKSFK